MLDLRLADRLLQDRNELLLADHHVVPGVAEHVGDLLGGQRVVDRERHRAEMEGGGVDEMEFGAVRQHDADGVAGPHAETGETGGEGTNLLGVLAPGVSDGVVRRPHGDVVGVRRRSGLKSGTEGGR